MSFDIGEFKNILKKHLNLYNINRLELDGDSLHINIIYNISGKKLSKPVYRNFDYSGSKEKYSTRFLKENLDYILCKERKHRIVSPQKILELSQLSYSLKSDYSGAMAEIREKIVVGGGDKSDEYILCTLSNDIVSWTNKNIGDVKYIFKIENTRVYVSNLKLHTIEYIDENQKNKLFDLILEVDFYIERLLDLKLKVGNFQIEECIDDKFLEGMERNLSGISILNKNSHYESGKGILIDRKIIELLDKNIVELDDNTGSTSTYKSYHDYLSNRTDIDLEREKIVYRKTEYEIVKLSENEYLILRLPQKIIVTDNRIIETIILKYNMLEGRK